MSQEQAGSKISDFTGHLLCDLGFLGRFRKAVLDPKVLRIVAVIQAGLS